MSTATTSTNAYADCDEFIEHRIRVARNRIKWTDLLTALLLAGVLLIGYVFIFTLCDHWVVTGGFTPVTRAVMLGVVVLLCAAIVYRYVIRPWTKEIHPLYAAKMLDGHDGNLDGALLSAVDLGSNNSSASEVVRRSIEKRAAVGLAAVNIDEAIDRKWLMNLGITLFFLVLFTCVYAVFSPKSMNLLRPLSLSSAAVATQTRILRVQPGSTMIQAGEELEIVADIAGNIPDAVHVLFTTEDQTYVDEQLTMSTADDAGRYRLNMVGDADRGLRQNFTYRIVAGDAASELFEVVVDEPPTANVSLLEYVYPDYMDLPKRSTANGNIDAWEGTDVFVTAETNVPVRLAILTFSDDSEFSVPAEEFSLTPDGNQLSGRVRLQVRSDGTTPKFYRINVTDIDGRTDPQPTVYSMKIRPDKAPLVRLLDPLRDMRVPANAVVPLLIEAEDPDFLLRSVKLELEVNGVAASDQLLFDSTRSSPTKSWSGTWDFNLGPLALKEGDVVRYRVVARDNWPPLGHHQPTSTLQLFVEERVSEEKVQQQLKEDRQLQEQQQRQMTPPEDASNNDDEQPNESVNDGQPGDETEEMESSDAGETSADENSAGGESQNVKSPDGTGNPSEKVEGDQGEPSETKTSDGDDPRSVSEPGDPGEENSNGGEDSRTGSSSDAASEKRDEPTDDSALQDILDAYKDVKESELSPSTEDGTGEAAVDQPEDGPSENSGLDAPPKSDDELPEDGTDATMDDASEGDNSAAADDTPGEQMTGDAGEDEKDDSSAENGADDQPMQNGDGAADENENTDAAGSDDPQDQQAGKQGDDQAQPETNQDPENPMQDDPQSPANDGEQSDQNGDPDANKQDGEAGKQGQESGKQDGEADKQGQESGKQDGEAGKQGQESDKQDGEAGKQGQESDKQDGEAGKQGLESGKKDGEAGKQQSGKSGDGKSGDGKSGDGKSGDGKSGDGKSGDGKSGDGKSGNGKSGNGKSGNGKGGEGKGGEGKGGEGKGGEGKGGEGKGGEGKGGEGKGGQSKGGKGKSQGGGKDSASGVSDRGNPASENVGKEAGGENPGGEDGKPNGGSGTEQSSPEFQADDANVTDAAQAADLVLKRLKKDLDRGKVDKKLLEKLGWTEDQLQAFSERMQKQLNTLKEPTDKATKSRQLQKRRVEELLKSLNLKSKSTGQIGSTGRNTEQQDTTSRRSPVPAKYKDLMQLYERSLSEGSR